MADQSIELDVRKALADIAQLKGGLGDLNKQVSKLGSEWDAAFGVSEAKAAVDVLNTLQSEFDQLKKSADVLKAAMKGATDPAIVKSYAENIAKLEKGMQTLSNAGKSVGANLEKVNKEAGTGKQVFEGLFGVFSKVTIILAAVKAVIDFTKYAVGLSQEIKKASKSFEAFTGSAEEAQKIVGSLQSTANKNFLPLDETLQAGKALLAFGENAADIPDVLTRIANISAATGKNFGELTTIYGKARAAGVLYAEDINQLVDAGIPIIQEFAKQMGVSNDQVKKLASEGKISFEELQLAIFNLTAESGKFANQAQIGADSIGGAWNKLLATIQPATEKIGGFFADLTQGAIYLLTDLADGVKNLFSDASKQKIEVDYTGRDAYEKAKDDLYERERLEKEAERKRLDRAKKTPEEIAKIEKEYRRLKLEAMKEGEAKDIAAENMRFEELSKQLKKYHISTEQAEEQHNINLRNITVKYGVQRAQVAQSLLDQLKKHVEDEVKIAKDAVERERKRAEGERDVRDSEIDILEVQFDNFIKAMEANGASKEAVAAHQLEFDNRIKSERIDNEIKYQEALLATINAGDTAQIEQIKNTIAKLNATKEGLTIGAPTPKGGKGKLPKDYLRDLFGFNDEQMQELEKAVGQVTDFLRQEFAAAVELANQRVQAAQKNTQTAQDYYDQQKQLQEDGFASDVDLAARRLEAAKQQEAAALEQKRKAQRQQILLDTALQASNLITASTQTLKTFNGPLLPIGIALVAAMFGAFFAAKAKAIQATKFKHGGGGRVDGDSIIVGASHDDGGVGIEAEGGEFFGTDGRRFGIVNKAMTAKHFDLLNAINKDDRGAMRAALEKLTGGASINRDNVLGAVNGSSSSTATRGQDNGLMPLLKEWKRESRGRSVTREGEYTVIREGNHTRRSKR